MAKEKITRVFQMDTDTAMMFFMIVAWSTDHGVKDSRKFRQYVLDWLAQKNKMQRVYDTKRTENQVIKGYRRQGYRLDTSSLQRKSIWEKMKQILGL